MQKLFVVVLREWMGKVERIRPRPSDGRVGGKESSEDPRAPSPGGHGQYSKSIVPQDYQVRVSKAGGQTPQVTPHRVVTCFS